MCASAYINLGGGKCFAVSPSRIGTNCYVMEHIGGDMNSGFSKSICVKVNATDWVGT